MRIGFAITSLHGGGAEFTVRRWTAELTARGHDVYLYTYKPPGSVSALVGAERQRHFPGRSRAVRVAVLPWWLRHWTERDEIDVLVTMMTFANLAAIVGVRSKRRPRVPVVISERNTLAVKLRLEGGNTAKLFMVRQLYRFADGVVAISHPVAAELAGSCKLDMRRTFVIPNPVTDAVSRSAETLTPQALHIVFVGRLVPVKRPDLFVETLVELKRRGIRVRGTVMGDGSLRGTVERLATESGLDIACIGWQEPWWEAVANVDCLLHPSDEEGFGNVLVEAAAAKIPCVARSSALGVADAVVPGVTGELVSGERPEDLADAVVRVVGLGDENARERWLEHFSVARSTDLLVAALGVVLAGER